MNFDKISLWYETIMIPPFCKIIIIIIAWILNWKWKMTCWRLINDCNKIYKAVYVEDSRVLHQKQIFVEVQFLFSVCKKINYNDSKSFRYLDMYRHIWLIARYAYLINGISKVSFKGLLNRTSVQMIYILYFLVKIYI